MDERSIVVLVHTTQYPQPLEQDGLYGWPAAVAEAHARLLGELRAAVAHAEPIGFIGALSPSHPLYIRIERLPADAERQCQAVGGRFAQAYPQWNVEVLRRHGPPPRPRGVAR